jgi:hypothetical protein
VTQQLMKQELADGATGWACRTRVNGSHGLPRSWDHGAERGWNGSITRVEHGSITGVLSKLLRSWGRKCPTMSWKIEDHGWALQLTYLAINSCWCSWM